MCIKTSLLLIQNLLLVGSPRTNNQCEGWHNKINKMIGVKSNIFKFINGLKAEQSEQEKNFARMEAGREPEHRRPKYIKSDERLLKIVKQFGSSIHDGSFLPYLKSIAHNTTISISLDVGAPESS